jgi:CRISPR-associated protein Cmr4
MQTKLLLLFTRTPLHVGAGSSVGAIDQPIQRERHTGFPVIPASSLKGSFADQWPNPDGEARRLTVKNGQIETCSAAAWLFGSDTTDLSFAGSLLFSEARILAFPIRSAKGSFAWITCPVALQRAVRDGVLEKTDFAEPKDEQAVFKADGPLALSGNQIVLEEYTFGATGSYPSLLATALAALVPNDPLFGTITDRLVILSNGQFSHFVATTCEVAQHVRIDDKTGTAEGTGLFNQENVPADTLFYSAISATASRVPGGDYKKKTADDALAELGSKLPAVFQFGGDASTGLGFCSVSLADRTQPS